MSFIRKSSVLAFLLLITISMGFSQEEAWDIHVQRETGETVKFGFITAGEILITNWLFMALNHMYGSTFPIPTQESLHRNLTQPWIWEDDGFLVNQLGHPFQGGLYYSNARAAGFGFYQSMVFSLFGSATWEAIFENIPSSFNDLITTVPGSFAAGEISYRLYIEAIAMGIPSPLAAILSPAAGMHKLLTGWEPPIAERNMHELRVFAGGGYAKAHSSVEGWEPDIFSFQGPHGGAGLKAIYGNPFEQNTFVPYRHFEFTLSYGAYPGMYQDIRVVSDGYLFAYNPVNTERTSMSTGLTMHMDYTARGRYDVNDSTVNQYSNALNWTLKYQYLFSENTNIQIKGHAGFSFVAASLFDSPNTSEYFLNSYGYGLNGKLFLRFENRILGRFEADFYAYSMWSFPGTFDNSHGFYYWLFTDLTYSRMITRHFSIGITGSLAREWGTHAQLPTNIKLSDTLILFVAWNM